ncbi:hypothetical protein DGWBC_1780 [Dehalogenimonas sp. WBC-2]|nr:hypothetical protein DGWBC_1780 [Dehalogenimonas sp. WBC-2]
MNQENKSPLKRRRGAPPGNCNARTHGYYSKVFIAQNRLRIEALTGFTGIDLELFQAKCRLQQVLQHKPVNVGVRKRMLVLFIGMVVLKYRVAKHDNQGLIAALEKVPDDFSLSPEILEQLEQC